MGLIDEPNIIRRFIEERDDKSALELIAYARLDELDDSEIIELAQGLSESGDSIQNENDFTFCDIPSTGGPSSLSTLLCPLFLKLLGGKVLKLGVPGRPAGGIDVLAQIRGYNINPTSSEIKKWILSSQYVHFLANKTFAPLDAKLFYLRKENNALNIPSFVIASLLSKKIAVGIKNVGLDIRLSSFGNFGKTIYEGRSNADRFNRISASLGIKSRCFLTNGDIPQQQYIGRGESILALNRIFNNKAEGMLIRHLGICQDMANSLFINKINEFPISSIKDVFYENLTIQGGDVDHFNKLSDQIEENNKYTIKSQFSGILLVDLFKIRKAITCIQHRINGIEFPDPCGLILKAIPGQNIEKGNVICSFRCIDKHLKDFEVMLNDAFGVSNQSNMSFEFEIIK